MKIKYIQYLLVTLIILLSADKTGFALEKIANYFLDNPNAWSDTKRITRNTPTKVTVPEGKKGLVFKLTDLTPGDNVSLIFLEAKKIERFTHEKICEADDKLIQGTNRIVSVITKNHGNRKKFHYKFMLQRTVNNIPVEIFNNGDSVLESRYDGNKPVEDMSDLSGIELLELEIR